MMFATLSNALFDGMKAVKFEMEPAEPAMLAFRRAPAASVSLRGTRAIRDKSASKLREAVGHEEFLALDVCTRSLEQEVESLPNHILIIWIGFVFRGVLTSRDILRDCQEGINDVDDTTSEVVVGRGHSGLGQDTGENLDITADFQAFNDSSW